MSDAQRLVGETVEPLDDAPLIAVGLPGAPSTEAPSDPPELATPEPPSTSEAALSPGLSTPSPPPLVPPGDRSESIFRNQRCPPSESMAMKTAKSAASQLGLRGNDIPCIPEDPEAPGVQAERSAAVVRPLVEPGAAAPVALDATSAAAPAVPGPAAIPGNPASPAQAAALFGSAAGPPSLAAMPPQQPWVPLTLALLALGPAIALYRRLTSRNMMACPTRQAVFERVVAAPGTTAGGIARALGVERRTVNHHLTVLHEFGAIEARQMGKRIRFYKNGGAYSESEKLAHAALANPKAVAVARVLARAPGVGLAELAQSTGLAKSTAKWHLARLERMGLVTAGALKPEAVDVVIAARA